MGNEANVKGGKTTTLKVPPIKIVLSSNQNSAVVNICNQPQGNDQSDGKTDTSGHASSRDVSHVDSKESGAKAQRKASRASPDDAESESNRFDEFFGSSSSSSTSECAVSTSPTSDSDSVASNSTIISDNHQVKLKVENESEASVVKREKESRVESKSNTTTESKPSLSNKRSHENSAESSQNETATSNPREHVANANQRITRSSQRAAQQNRAETSNDLNAEDPNISENQDKPNETSRKTKRRRGEPQDTEQDGNQANSQPVVTLANICPADYQLPSQNSFELYRDIRKRPYKKMLQLNHVQPRAPQGFKDYLINGGPYLLDGNKLGVGFNGQRLAVGCDQRFITKDARFSSRTRMPVKLSNLRVPSHNSSKQRHYNYNIPKPTEAPKKLPIGSSLHNLFMDQEKARHQMRMQHLKERERSILAAEQEILRAYNKIAIANSKQQLHLSACTYFYYQERYHYLDERTEKEKIEDSKGVTHCQDASSLCKDGDDNAADVATKISSSSETTNTDSSCGKEKGKSPPKDSDTSTSCKVEDKNITDKVRSNEDDKLTRNNKSNDISGTLTTKSNGSKEDQLKLRDSGAVKEDKSNPAEGSNESTSINESVEQGNKSESTTDLSDDEFKSLNKKVFLDHLQEIDDKWAKIRKEMYTRHRNESDSLYAVQTLDWEWRAKEIGACDVRVSLRIEPELVPKVEVSKLDY